MILTNSRMYCVCPLETSCMPSETRNPRPMCAPYFRRSLKTTYRNTWVQHQPTPCNLFQVDRHGTSSRSHRYSEFGEDLMRISTIQASPVHIPLGTGANSPTTPRSYSCCTPVGHYTLTPTFTQGLVLGQLSIFLLVYFILKYLFFDPKSAQHLEESPEEDAPHFRPSSPAETFVSTASLQKKVEEQDGEHDEDSVEPAELLYVLLK